jgi:hypothetical protein
MAKKIEIVGAKSNKIELLDQPKRRFDPAELAAVLGANSAGRQASGNLDLFGLAELGTQLLNRLRSSGGRPALADATEMCRVPLSAQDVKTLESMVAQIEASSGAKPSVGQLVSVIVRTHLSALSSVPKPVAPAGALKQDATLARSKTMLQQMIDEHITPLREQVERLESELQAAVGAAEK